MRQHRCCEVQYWNIPEQSGTVSVHFCAGAFRSSAALNFSSVVWIVPPSRKPVIHSGQGNINRCSQSKISPNRAVALVQVSKLRYPEHRLAICCFLGRHFCNVGCRLMVFFPRLQLIRSPKELEKFPALSKLGIWGLSLGLPHDSKEPPSYVENHPRQS